MHVSTRWLAAMLLALSTSLATAQVEEAVEPPALPSEEPQPEPKENPMVVIKTSLGDIKAELFQDKAPLTVANFLQYAKDGHYNGTIFHRIIDNFMIQGGGFTKDMAQKRTRAPVKNEAANGLKNERGTLAMARTSVIDSATSQFFINVKDNDFLNHTAPTPQGFGYCVFGKVVEGMDVVDKIKSVQTGNRGPFQDVPVETVEIIEIVQAE